MRAPARVSNGTADVDRHVPFPTPPVAPGGSWFQSCTPRSWDAKSNILVARCSGNIDVTLNYGLCATGATVSYSSPTLLCSAMSTATTNVVGEWVGAAVLQPCWPSPFCEGMQQGPVSLLAAHLNTTHTTQRTSTSPTLLFPPGGTWVRSCSPVSLNGTTLAASCGKYAPSNPKRPDGIQQAVITTINAASCANNAVEVDNHVLVVSRGGSWVAAVRGAVCCAYHVLNGSEQLPLLDRSSRR